MSKETGGPAFPGFDYINQDGRKNPEGMTMRDYFAAAFLANQYCAGTLSRSTAIRAYEVADAMLEARK